MKIQKKLGKRNQNEERKDNAEPQEDGISIQEVARILGITPTEVQQIEKRALKKLRCPRPALRRLHDTFMAS